ncbi:TetR/AcrR family transcriptional regulator C-terminal domain-containing protein [Levilactobacillus brevis]|nr:TetR/AcrR family transcriptional regulator [Levilactobacillus brevis]
MISQPTDPRVVRTNERLRQALSTLLQEMSFKQVSVQKLTQAAAITRGTFYLHYQDKADFLAQTEQQVIDEWLAAGKTLLAPYGHPVNGFALGPALRYVDDHHQILMVLLQPQFAHFRTQLQQRLEQELLVFSQQLPQSNVLTSPLDVQVSFLATGFIGVIDHWLADDRRYRPDYLAQAFQQLLPLESLPVAAWFAPINPEKR